MARQKKQPEAEQQAGAPEWMVTFSDCMTLLLTFFVLLLSFSSFDDTDYFRKMNSSFAEQFSFCAQSSSDKDALSAVLKPVQELNLGSEKPTLTNGLQDHFKKQTEPMDFLKFKTFLVSSNRVFWGKGPAISINGRKVLNDLSAFLKEFPGYFVIVSETGPQDTDNLKNLGFNRAWSVVNYLIDQKGLLSNQLSISASGTVAKEYHSNSIRQGDDVIDARVLEIVLMKRGI